MQLGPSDHQLAFLGAKNQRGRDSGLHAVPAMHVALLLGRYSVQPLIGVAVFGKLTPFAGLAVR